MEKHKMLSIASPPFPLSLDKKSALHVLCEAPVMVTIQAPM